ncbi:MAG: ribose 5-phosphate isomerase B [Elusimicrobiota bacterium]
MKIAIGNDHAGYDLKSAILKYLHEKAIIAVDCGSNSKDSCDYPDYAKDVALKVISKEVEAGILICGTGIGMSICANKFKGIRAALCLNTEMARLSRRHNNANILCLGARLINQNEAIDIIHAWLNSSFEGGRHEKRLSKIAECENPEY